MNNSSSETIKNSLENKRIQGSLLKNEDVQLNEKLKKNRKYDIADCSRWQRTILGNLLNNAIELTKAGEGIIGFVYKIKANFLEFFVNDNGNHLLMCE